jgi:hypothetical protein
MTPPVNTDKGFSSTFFHRRDAEFAENSIFWFLPLRPLRLCGAILTVLLLSQTDRGQEPSKEVKDKIDGAVRSAYQTASTGFPCRLKGRGKPKMLRWEEVDRCLNSAAERVDWDVLKRQLESLRAASGTSAEEFRGTVESGLSQHALTYERVFAVKDPEVLLPLTNSLLKFLPADSLEDVPVFDRVGTQMGTFLGTYSYERSGGLASANTYRLALFQYKDRNGNVQPAGDKLLLDSFGVPWKEAQNRRGFRLPSDKLFE